MIISEEIIEGIFVEESKNRFLCRVMIEKEIIECYVPSASKLKNYLNMKGKNVLLLRNKKINTRTKYSLFAVQYYKQYIIVNLLFVNRILEEYLRQTINEGDIFRERFIGGYKSDFFISGQKKIIVEAKGIISPRKRVQFPTVYSNRAVNQLNNIIEFLKEGYDVQYYLVSLSPIVDIISINDNVKFIEYTKLLYKCIENGMIIKGLGIKYKNGCVVLTKNIKILV